MNTNIFIPEKIKVGYNKREDTYTKKLAYVIYYDNKGVLRKEKSWESWRENDLGEDDFTNEPMEGFVLNKGVGGARQSYGWNPRNEYIRVYDPRNFEFEISVANLLWILQECTSTKGKGLEGKFVYGWQGTELILIPAETKEYDDCVQFTKLQDGKIGVKDLVVGCIYKDRNQKEWIYMGKFKYYTHYYTSYYNKYENDKSTYRKKFMFASNDESKDVSDFSSLNSFKEKVSDVPVENISDIICDWEENDSHASPYVGTDYVPLTEKDIKNLNNWSTTLYLDDVKMYVQHKYIKPKTIDGKYIQGYYVDNMFEYISENKYSSSYYRYDTNEYKDVSGEELLEKFKKKINIFENKFTCKSYE